MAVILKKLMFNKYTLVAVIIAILAGVFYYQDTKIDSLNKQIIIKETDILELKQSIKELSESQKKQDEIFEEQISKLKEYSDLKIESERKVFEKVIKESRREEDEIFDRKIKFAESQYNKHIKINVDKWNNKDE